MRNGHRIIKPIGWIIIVDLALIIPSSSSNLGILITVLSDTSDSQISRPSRVTTPTWLKIFRTLISKKITNGYYKRN